MITVNFDGEKDTYKTASGLWQWDYGQVLQLAGLSLPAAVEIHFSLQQSGGDAITRIGVTEDNTTNVGIPDEMLENNGKTTDYTIYAFVYTADEESGETVYRISMPVKSRPRPKRVSETTMKALMAAINKIADGKADGLEYKNNVLRLLSGEKELSRVTIAGGSGSGEDGITPHIGDNGNWYLGETDTGKPSRGENGKSAYQYAQEGGYTGTEEEFAALVGKQIQQNKEDISKLSEEKVNNPPTGVVGQILEIETVDENGKPKTYKAVNKPIGGGEVTDEQISNAVDNYMAANPIEESDPTVPEWAKQPEKPIYTASEVGADASGTAESKLSVHNTATDSHNDIRLLIEGLTTRLNALADSDDTTLDQLSEIVTYIKYNRSLINGISANKIDVSDIVNNLTSNNTDKPLSAKQGRVLKSLIDAITIPDKIPNPYSLTFTGAASGTYDGSAAVTINIPSGSTGDSGDSNYYVTPEQFGAVGDGINDDTNAINQSLASGKPIYFSAKTYKVSSSLTLQTGTRMYGNGAKIFFVPKTELYFGLHLLNISDVLIKDFYFDSERTQTGWAPAGHTRNDLSTSLVDCICIQNSKDIIIENCNFNNMESDFWMQNATAGYSSENIIIRNWYSRNSSMPLFANNSTNVIIENANAEPANIGGDGDHIIYISDGCNHWKINDFTFTAPDDTYGALCTIHGSTEYEGNVIIDNCKFVGKDKVLLYSYVTGEIKIINSILETTESLIGGSFLGNYIIENSDITCGNLSVTSNDSENGNYKIGIKINNCNLECLWEVLAITNGTFIFSNSNIKFSTFFINCRANGEKANVEINRCTIEKTGTSVYFIAVRSSKYAFKITHTTFISNTSNTQLMYIAGSDITSLSEYILCGVIVLSTVSNSSISMFSGYSGTLDAKMSGCFYGQE